MAKALSINEIRKRCVAFAAEWRDEPGEEKQQAQTFVRDLLKAFGITGNKAALYEKRAKRTSTGNQGYIDALVPGLCLIEMKSRGKDLVEAEKQAMDYIDALEDIESPRWIITSDFETFRVHDLEASEGADTEIFTLLELPRHVKTLGFLAGYQTRSFGDKRQESASIKAAKLMADLYEGLEGSGYDDHEASVFLVRTLFALYADDAGVWERDLFYEFLEMRTNEDGSDLGGQLTMLYQALNKKPEARQKNIDDLLAQFPYVNGGVFAEPLSIPAFDSAMRDKLIRACAFNWSAISPAIFGSLFQAVKDRTARRDLGEHYTTETNILKTIQPLFLDELHQRFADNVHNISGLKKLRTYLGELHFLDPACGCGNFLVVAYREMRALELRILQRLQELGDTSQIPMLYFTKDDISVSMDRFTGFEIEEWPARIASTALHLVDHQANQAMELALGKAPDPLPLGTIETIHVGNALRTDWGSYIAPSEKILFILGNPPFLGHKERTEEQKEDLQLVWGTDRIGQLDYVTGWYAKAIELFSRPGYRGQFAFVSTNSISLGDSVPALFRPIFAAGWRIKFAHRTFRWSSEAPGKAQVHCVIIGFVHRAEKSATRLFDYVDGSMQAVETRPQQINAYLVDGPNVIITPRRNPLSSSLPVIDSGSTPIDWGHLTIESLEELNEVQKDAIAAKYVRRYLGGKELINNIDRWCLWLEGASAHDISTSSVMKKRVEAVQAARSAPTVKRPATRELAATPHLFGERRQPSGNYLAIPQSFAKNVLTRLLRASILM